MEIEEGNDGKQRKKHFRLSFKVRKELALFVHVNFFFHCPLFRAFAGIACHGLPNSACTENNGAPVWKVRVVEGDRNGRVGVGPTLLPQIIWVGSRTPCPGLEEGMGMGGGAGIIPVWVPGYRSRG